MKNLQIWFDRYYINKFILYFSLVGPFLCVFLGFFSAFRFVLKEGLQLYEYLTVFCFISVAILFCIFLIACWVEEHKTFRAISLGSGKVIGALFFCDQFMINFEEILALRNIKLNLMMKQMKLFKGEELGFDIVLKTGKIYHCSPHMEEVQRFRAELLKELKEGGYTLET